MEGNSFIDSYKRAIDVILHPGVATKDTMTLKSGIIEVYKVGLIPAILGIIISVLLGSTLATTSTLGLVSGAFVSLLGVIGVIIEYILEPLLLIIVAGIYHLIVGKLFRIYKSGFSNVYTAFVYGIFPYMLLFWLLNVPGLNIVLAIVIIIWEFIIQIIALSNQLHISRFKAFGTLLLEYIIIVIISALISFALLLPVLTGAVGPVPYSGSRPPVPPYP
ncbi:MAG: hypothetical protein ARM1_0608 [Candidatus Micrarchaeota archaeon]|nr:MAG: hypothetical protein ARM1_0608 [Candidatus Micrarchaeota archaeon]